MIDLTFVFLGYLLGGITVGYYLVRWLNKQDIRNLGSGATGATNVGRVLGRKGLIITASADVLKGILVPSGAVLLELSEITIIMSLIAVIAGHIWPLQLGFRGGKGIATGYGGLAVIDPLLVAVLLSVSIMYFVISKKHSLSGLFVITASPLVAIILNRAPTEIFGLVIVSFMIFIAHGKNIRSIIMERLKRRM